jgi:acyl carrier protein
VSFTVLIDQGKVIPESAVAMRSDTAVGLRVVDEKGAAVSGVGETGLLEVTGVNVMMGYFDDLYRENRVVSDQPGVRTVVLNDLVTLGDGGTISLVGRADSVVKSGGRRVSLAEIEVAAETLPGVSRAIALADETEVPPRIWLAVEGVLDLKDSAIAARVAALTAAEARPRRIRKFERLPKLESGKVDVQAVRRILTDGDLGAPAQAVGDAKHQPDSSRVLSTIKGWLTRNNVLDADTDSIADVALADNYIESLVQLDLLMFLEQEFEISIDYRYLAEIATPTFGSLADAVARSMRTADPKSNPSGDLDAVATEA